MNLWNLLDFDSLLGQAWGPLVDWVNLVCVYVCLHLLICFSTFQVYNYNSLCGCTAWDTIASITVFSFCSHQIIHLIIFFTAASNITRILFIKFLCHLYHWYRKDRKVHATTIQSECLISWKKCTTILRSESFPL